MLTICMGNIHSNTGLQNTKPTTINSATLPNTAASAISSVRGFITRPECLVNGYGKFALHPVENPDCVYYTVRLLFTTKVHHVAAALSFLI